VFDYIERFYNPRRRHWTIGYWPDGIRKVGVVSLGWCPPNRQQLACPSNLKVLILHYAIFEMKSPGAWARAGASLLTVVVPSCG